VTTHRLEVEGEPVFGLVHRDVPDRYAVAVCFLKNRQPTPTMFRLWESGWQVEYTDDYALLRRDPGFCRDIDLVMKKFIENNGKKFQPSVV
jgi:hypothetical protein